MEASRFVREAIDGASIYSNVELRPDARSLFCSDWDAREYANGLDLSFHNVFNQAFGYFQMKRYAEKSGDLQKFNFIEDAMEYRCSIDASIRFTKYVGCGPIIPHAQPNAGTSGSN